MKYSILVAPVLALTVAAFVEPSAEDAIRTVRSSSNRAIAKRDVTALAQTWLPDLNVTISSGAVVSSGEEMTRLFDQAFSDPDLITYLRTPSEIRLSPGKTYAAESGDWTGRWREGAGEKVVGGTYLAQWHKVEEGWRIRSELFVALSCEGSEECHELP